MKINYMGLEVDTILVPQLNPNDEFVEIKHFDVINGQYINKETQLFIIETSKATFEYCAESSGYIYIFTDNKEKFNVGEIIGLISPNEQLSTIAFEQFKIELLKSAVVSQEYLGNSDVVISKKAKELIQKNNLKIENFNTSAGVIRESDVLNYISNSNLTQDDNTEFEKIATLNLNDKNLDVKKNYIDEFNHIKTGVNCFIGQGVSMSNVSLGDRVWVNRNATIYGSNVSIGNDCYIGPSVWIEGHAGIIIGDSVHIAGPGTCLYTHSGIKIALSGESLGNPEFKASSRGYYHEKIIIGNNVWIGPNCTMFPGVIIEDFVVVFPNTLIKKGVYKSFSLLLPDGKVEEDSLFVKNLLNKNNKNI